MEPMGIQWEPIGDSVAGAGRTGQRKRWDATHTEPQTESQAELWTGRHRIHAAGSDHRSPAAAAGCSDWLWRAAPHSKTQAARSPVGPIGRTRPWIRRLGGEPYRLNGSFELGREE